MEHILPTLAGVSYVEIYVPRSPRAAFLATQYVAGVGAALTAPFATPAKLNINS